jgi:hypothetical protein
VTEYSVFVEHELDERIDPDQADAILDALEVVGARGSALSVGEHFGVQLSVSGDWPVGAAEIGFGLVGQAAEKAGLRLGEVRRIDVLTEAALDEQLAEPEPTYAGVTEVAGLLGVSKQRVSELRTSAAFPAPIAELAAGPVWSVPTLTRFIDTWERKPGRPRKVAATG